jgi:hypothetical protein
MRTKTVRLRTVVTAAIGSFILASSIVTLSAKEPVPATKFQVDRFWPKPLPDAWLTGSVGGDCVDSKDHVFIMSRSADADNYSKVEQDVEKPAPPVIEFDQEGNVVNSWGDPKVVPSGIHDCYFDHEGNIWISGNADGIAQKYTHDGKLLLQIGTKGKFDTVDGTLKGAPLNASHTLLNRPTGFAEDPENGDIYIADGYGNRRVVVFDRDGKYIRQFGRQATKEEAATGVGGVFLHYVHSLLMSNEGLLYVADREGQRIQVFDKMGNFKKNIFLPRRRPELPGHGTPFSMVFSRDKGQKYIYVGDGVDEIIQIVDRETGQTVGPGFGRRGHNPGEFYLHSIAIDSKGDIFVGEGLGRRVQKFKAIGN